MSHSLKRLCLAAVAFLSTAAFAFAATDWAGFDGDVLIVGEFHDNPDHHAEQAQAARVIRPKAVVFEMLTPEEAAALSEVTRGRPEMRAATEGFHWPNIADYAEVLAVSSVIVGAALPRDEVRAAFGNGAAAVFGPGAETYGLADPLPEAEQEAREDAQFAAHCEAMPREMMGGMVEAQRLRDAAFARTVLEALDTYGGPVLLITGNGHARMDWGVPVYLSRVRPDLQITSVGQGEGEVPPQGVFSRIVTEAPVPDRGDPCAAFR